MPEGEGGFIEVMANAISAIAPGLENFGAEVGAEMSRLGPQGAAELASALFSDGNSYVAYGRGQYTPSAEVETGIQAQEVQAPEVQAPEVQAVAPPVQEYGGME